MDLRAVGVHLCKLAHIGDGPSPGDEAVSDWPHKGRHEGHGQVGDEREQRGGLHGEAQGQLEEGGQPCQQRVVAPIVAEVRHYDGPDRLGAQEHTPRHRLVCSNTGTHRSSGCQVWENNTGITKQQADGAVSISAALIINSQHAMQCRNRSKQQTGVTQSGQGFTVPDTMAAGFVSGTEVSGSSGFSSGQRRHHTRPSSAKR